jgi:ZIP family zinc transporter
MFEEKYLIVFALTCFAGLATGVGSCIAFFAKRTSTKALCAALGFSAGVMIYISFVELLAGAQNELRQIYGGCKGSCIAISAFFGGILITALIDKLVPSYENPHEVHKVEEMSEKHPKNPFGDRKLSRAGLFFALAIGIHNFPEGLATFAAGLKNISLGISIAVAIAIHNIPEGIAVSVPIYYATGSKRKAFGWSMLSGLAEPLGALAGFAFLYHFMSDTLLAILLASVAGVMVYISFDELLPMAEEYGEHHISLYGLILGMAVMAFSLAIL